MMYLVKQPFSTPSRRFAPGGDPVTKADLAGPVPVATWLDLKMIEPVTPDPVKPTKGKAPGDPAPPSPEATA